MQVAPAHLVVDHKEAQQALGEVLHLQAVAAADVRQATTIARYAGVNKGSRAAARSCSEPILDKLIEPHKLFGGLDPAEDHLDVVLDGRFHNCVRGRVARRGSIGLREP